MSSVQATAPAGGAFVAKLGAATFSPVGNWWAGGWFRINDYSTAFTQVFSIAGTVVGFVGADTGETTNDAIDVYVGGSGFTFQTAAIAQNNYKGWIFIAVTHVAGTSVYTFYSRTESVGVLTVTTLNSGTEIPMPTQNIQLLGDSDGDPSAGNARAFHIDQVVPTVAQLLAFSETLATPGGTPLVYLPLLTVATAGSNTGTAGNFTTGGTLTDSTSQPNVLPNNNLFFGAGTTS